MARTLYLVRHAVTAWNTQKRWQGQTDIPLCEEGRTQARALVERLRGRGLVSVYTSDLSRARETAEIIAGALNLPLLSERDLRERAFGLFEGKTATECAALGEIWQRYKADRCFPPGAEPDEDVVARMSRVVERVAAALPDDHSTALVVSHSSSIRSLLLHMVGQAFPSLPNGGLYRLTLTPNQRAECEPIS